ncbi:DUF6542 domain-containing protein [Geodermatophilus sp. DSM 44513]|uniref:DUF6542 domain-containing protein n=1 Tax=Geodermatophilus sp. DSM 44513 TaxID=1528104 RepID=UPI0028F6E8A0|nr:DUF6542 domain-containing protein [Geodermatophilus sp. DSM 44513]WNV76495.1 hypothetical protein RTG05_04295 [Geodermatophilus sp. DSM 44513]
MATVNSASTWREPGVRSDRRPGARPGPADAVSRIGRPPVPPPPPRMRSADLPPFPEDTGRAARGRDVARARDGRPAPGNPRVPLERAAPPARDAGRGTPPVPPAADRRRLHEDHLRTARDRDEPDARTPRPSGALRPAGREAAERGSRLRGAVAVLAVFLVTLAGAAVESWISTGLGPGTLALLTLTSAAAAAVVRRRDLLTTLVAPPLVYVVVAVLNTALAPSASLNLASVATLLIRGFPAMAIATAAAAVVGLVRWAARR